MTRALDETDNITSIDNVDNGKACNCHCIVCQTPLIARQGKKRSWHFAHGTSSGDVECAWSGETELHLRVKEYLSTANQILVPIGIHQPSFETIKIEDTLVEMRFDPTRRIPDVTTFSKGEKVFIEIAVTHFCDAQKIKEYKSHNANALEFDFSNFEPEGDTIKDKEIEEYISHCEVSWLSVAPAGYIGSKVHNHERKAIQKLHEEYIKQDLMYSKKLQEITKKITLRTEELRRVENILSTKSPEAEEKKAIMDWFSTEERKLQQALKIMENNAIRQANISAEEQFNASFSLLKQDMENQFRLDNKLLIQQIETKEVEAKTISDLANMAQHNLDYKKTQLEAVKKEANAYLEIEATIKNALKSLESKIVTIAQARKQLAHILPEFKGFCRKTGTPWPFAYDIDTKLNTSKAHEILQTLISNN